MCYGHLGIKLDCKNDTYNFVLLQEVRRQRICMDDCFAFTNSEKVGAYNHLVCLVVVMDVLKNLASNEYVIIGP